MRISQWKKHLWVVLASCLCWWPGAALADAPPAQKLPSALLVFPLIEATGTRDTRLELLNLSGDPQLVQCFYIAGDTCNEIGFLISLTPYQPIAWLASAGLNNTQTGSAAPPFSGQGEMKCAVIPPRPELQFHNTIQGRATDFDVVDGTTVSYGAVAFQRLTDGDFTNVVSLDGVTYAQCPDKLHFDVLADQPASFSEIILAPCSEDLLFQMPATITVQYLITNEFEQAFSTSKGFTCFDREALGAVTSQLTRVILGTDTAHVTVRGSNGPLIGLVIDGVTFAGKNSTAGNEPSFQGGRSATLVFP